MTAGTSASALTAGHCPVIVGVSRQPGRGDQQVRVGVTVGVEPRRRQAQRVLPATRPVGVDAVGVAQQQSPPNQR